MTGKSQEAHLAIVTNTETGLFHGALYVNHPTPSGSDRYLLSKTTTDGYATQRSAAMAINASYPDLDQLDLEMLPAEVDQDIDQLIAALPKLATITLITPRGKRDGNPYVEVRRRDISKKTLPIPIHHGMVNKLKARKIIEFDSTSGDDPELSARYDHYVVIGEDFSGIQKMTTFLEYLYLTASIMNEFNVAIRDTFHSVNNADDWYSNGERYNGPRLFKIDWIETDRFPELKHNKIYAVPGYRSAAYDASTLIMPMRYRDTGRIDPIVHECVHFLQHNTVEEDKVYINFNGGNYNEYLGQRTELEAHVIQIAYIFGRCSLGREAVLTSGEQIFVREALSAVKSGKNIETFLPAMLLCKQRNII